MITASTGSGNRTRGPGPAILNKPKRVLFRAVITVLHHWLQRVFGNKWLRRALTVFPPILFALYLTHSAITIRQLMKVSSSFHMDFANNLIQDYLSHAIELEREALRSCLAADRQPCPPGSWLQTEAGAVSLDAIVLPDGRSHPVFLKGNRLEAELPAFFTNSRGLADLFVKRSHEPVYWFQIFDPERRVIYQSGTRPSSDQKSAEYPMDRSLKNYRLEVIYNSFGPKQLYSVARTRINFGLILFLFLGMVFSLILFTRSIRQKIILAKQKTFFVSTVSHEFKTPLAIMKLAAETLELKRYKSAAEEQRFLQMLKIEINRLNHLVHKILSYNKIEMKQVFYMAREIDLRDVAKLSLDAFQVQARAEGIELKVELCDRPCPIWGDPDLIRHALDNILDNAFKYRGDSNRIDFYCERGATEVKLTVKDYGIGIAPEEQSLIYKSFYRIDDPIVLGTRGSGLGLAISQYILKRSHGTLKVQSKLREGSSFTMALPLRKVGETPGSESPKPLEKTAHEPSAP